MTSSTPGSNLVRIHSDEPALDTKHFGFDGYADALAGVIANKQNETPLVMGIYGPWGSGKTTLMKAIKKRLSDDQADHLAESLGAKPEELRQCKTVWFQAWKYDQESEILAGLLETIFQTMADDDFFSQAKGQIEKLAKGLNKQKIFGYISKLASGVDVTEFFSELEYKKHQGFYDIFRDFFEDLIQIYLDWRCLLRKREQPDDCRGVMVIFIDDLDRCPETRIVKVLETIKLFMDHKGCVFVIGAARDIIVKALAKVYEDDAHRFMEKIVQVSFSLPKVTEEMFQPYLKGLGQGQEEMIRYLGLIMPAMGNNPRQMNRFLNNLNLRHGLMRGSGLSIAREPVLHWGIIEHAFPDAARDFADNPGNLEVLQKKLGAIQDKLGHAKVWEADEQLVTDVAVPDSLVKYLRNAPLAGVLNSLEIEKESFVELVTFAASTKPEEAAVASPARQLPGRRTKSMTEVPAGSFKFGEKPDDAQIDTPYWIDIYLVSNARYRAFIDDGGYENQKWWEDGWQWREEKRALRPAYWDDSMFNRDEQPVVGVSWYEAAAFCNWLTEKSNDGFTYHLPSEKQWERAARGKDGLLYPWGDAFHQDRCNTKESGIGRPTRVDRYANGVSPVGCYDMAGNVWEWSADFYDRDRDSYTLRGGSWYYSAKTAVCIYRSLYGAGERDIDMGFRCARTKN